MFDLDDLQLLSASQSAPLFERASQSNSRSHSAVQLATTYYPELDRARPVSDAKPWPWLAVLIPPEMRGISRLVQSLVATGLPVTLTIHDFSAPASNADVLCRRYEALGLSPTIILNAIPQNLLVRPTISQWYKEFFSGRNARQLDISVSYTGEDHPVTALLFLLALLGQLCGHPLDLTISEPLSQRVRSYHTETLTTQNPAKSLARQLYARIPVFWSNPAMCGLAADCALRYQWYAESAAQSTDSWTLSRTHIMSRFPRYWPNTAAYVHIDSPVTEFGRASNIEPASDHDNDEQDRDEPMLAASIHAILARRHFPSHQVIFRGASTLEQCVEALEFSEWLALYAAHLYEIDPTARVPFQLLF